MAWWLQFSGPVGTWLTEDLRPYHSKRLKWKSLWQKNIKAAEREDFYMLQFLQRFITDTINLYHTKWIGFKLTLGKYTISSWYGETDCHFQNVVRKEKGKFIAWLQDKALHRTVFLILLLPPLVVYLTIATHYHNVCVTLLHPQTFSPFTPTQSFCVFSRPAGKTGYFTT